MKRKQVDWLLWNALFSAGLYFGVWLDVAPVGYGVIGFVWLMLVCYLLVLYTGDKKTVRKQPVPTSLGVLFDIGVLMVLVSRDWYVTATAYALTVIVLGILHRNSTAANTN
jgi:hypothetical protein